MNATQSLSTQFADRPGLLASPAAQQLLALSKERGWNCQVLGQAPLPTEPVRVRRWLLVPAQDDSSQIPARPLARVQALYAAGLRPKGFVLVHEAPLELAAPQQPGTRSPKLLELPPELMSGLADLGKTIVEVAPGVVIFVAKAAALVVAVGAAAVLGGPLALLFGLALLDPILVAVTEDGYWIEIDRWWN